MSQRTFSFTLLGRVLAMLADLPSCTLPVTWQAQMFVSLGYALVLEYSALINACCSIWHVHVPKRAELGTGVVFLHARTLTHKCMRSICATLASASGFGASRVAHGTLCVGTLAT